ncbi:MAG: hemerythrin family protein [SAR324 cluster bacterium]|nr:hemerythrin family protein [SAR324 cluster bacterium]
MNELLWTEEDTVFDEKMDAQHRDLFKMIGVFSLAVAGKLEDQLNNLFKFLERYVEYHFTAEEELMRQYNYPGLQSHVIQHQALRNKVHLEYEDFLRDKNISPDLVKFLQSWLKDHIKGSDRQYGEFIRDLRNSTNDADLGK